MTASRHDPSNIVEFLRSVPLLKDLSDDVLWTLSRSSRVRTLSKGELLFSQTDQADAVFMVHSGCVSIFLATPDGRELVINEMLPGDCFGELSVLTDQSRSTGAFAREATEVIWIPQDEFMRSLKDEPELMRRVLETTAQRLRVSSERESALAFLDSPSRIARMLLDLDEQGEGYGVVRVTQEELAHYVGLARQTVAKVLGEWRREGWVQTGRGRVNIIDRANLKQIARREK